MKSKNPDNHPWKHGELSPCSAAGSSPDQRLKKRTKLHSDIDAFLANGGKIQPVETGCSGVRTGTVGTFAVVG